MNSNLWRLLAIGTVFVLAVMLCTQYFLLWILWDAIKDINRAIDDLQGQLQDQTELDVQPRGHGCEATTMCRHPV